MTKIYPCDLSMTGECPYAYQHCECCEGTEVLDDEDEEDL